MERRTFQAPNIFLDTEIEFCAPSWQRANKYVTINHWLATKARIGRKRRKNRSLRYKLFEIGHYAGGVVLEIGLECVSQATVALNAAVRSGVKPQYYGISSDSESIERAREKFTRKRINDRAVFFQGTLTQFRQRVPISPTMVIVNPIEPIRLSATLSSMSLFLADGVPVLIRDCYSENESNVNLAEHPEYQRCGRFGNSALLCLSSAGNEAPVSFSETDFVRLQNRLTDGTLNPKRQACRELDGIVAAKPVLKSKKKWPYCEDQTEYPSTLPDGTPWPKISIVTPSYNQGQFIEDTINSVLNQGYPKLQYIVVDGQSDDETGAILDRYRHRIDHLICEADDGQSDAINKGMELADGDILTWLNSDDMLTTGSLYAMAMAFWKSKADMVVGTLQLIEDGKISKEHLTSCENGPLQLAELLDLDNHWLQGRFFYQPELMFTRQLWERAGGHVNKKLYFSMDYELWLRFAIAGANVHVIGRPTAMYRVHDQQKTHQDYQPELRGVNRRYIEKYGGLPNSLISLKPKEYKAVFVNDIGPHYGAGIAHGRLRESMVAAGHETQWVFAKPSPNAPAKTQGEMYQEIEAANPDIVVFGNLHHAKLDINLVDIVSERWPSCFVMHDLWLSTGRCCYLSGCSQYQSNCDSACPTASQYPALNPEQIENAFESKLNVIAKPRKTVVMTNSDYTKQIADRSAITSKSVLKRLKYGFPTDIYKPRDQKLCREILGLPQDAFILLFAAVNVSEQRKGLHHLLESVSRMTLENLLPVCLGYSEGLAELFPEAISLGYVDDPRRSAMIYSAADVFVGPSLEEAFGQVFIEAAACGTPSIGYPVGGVPEAITDGVTGLIAETPHPSSLAEQIQRLYLDDQYRKELSVWGRLEIENEWSYRSAYHHFNNLLREVPEHIGFLPPPSIQFRPKHTVGLSGTAGRTLGLLQRKASRVLPCSGFVDPVSISLKDGTNCEARWIVGKRAQLSIFVADGEQCQLRLKCLNPVPEQNVEVVLNGDVVCTMPIEVKPEFFDPIQLTLIDSLAPGEHQLELRLSATVPEQNGTRDLGLLVTQFDLVSNDQTLQCTKAA